jgi:hypothetical protein
MTDTHYSINGVNIGYAAANAMEWVLLRNGTTQLGGITRSLNSVTVPGYDGHFSAPATRAAQTLIFTIQTPRENLEALLAVLAHVGYDASFPTLGKIEVSTAVGQAAYYELASAIPSSTRPNDEVVRVTATLVIPSGAWRDESTTTTTVSIPSSPTVVTTIGSGISLPISDSDIFIEGNVGTMQITDTAGSWLRTTGDYVFESGYGVFYQASTGRAYKAANASPWVPVGDLGFAVDVSGGGFKITPKFTPTAPNIRASELTVLSTLVSGVSVKVRWRGAYVLK